MRRLALPDSGQRELARITPVSEPARSGLIIGIGNYRSLVGFANLSVNVVQYIITLFVRGDQTKPTNVNTRTLMAGTATPNPTVAWTHPFGG